MAQTLDGAGATLLLLCSLTVDWDTWSFYEESESEDTMYTCLQDELKDTCIHGLKKRY